VNDFQPPKPKRCWYHLTPARFLMGLVGDICVIEVQPFEAGEFMAGVKLCRGLTTAAPARDLGDAAVDMPPWRSELLRKHVAAIRMGVRSKKLEGSSRTSRSPR